MKAERLLLSDAVVEMSRQPERLPIGLCIAIAATASAFLWFLIALVFVEVG